MTEPAEKRLPVRQPDSPSRLKAITVLRKPIKVDLDVANRVELALKAAK